MRHLLDDFLGRRFLNAATAAISSVRSEAHCTFLEDRDLATSLDVLRSFRGSFDRFMSPTSLTEAFRNLLVQEEPRYEDVDIRDVTALSASKGRYIANLPRLATTISPPSIDILSMSIEQQVKRLRRDVWREGLVRDKEDRFMLNEEGWSGRGWCASTAAAFSHADGKPPCSPAWHLVSSRLERDRATHRRKDPARKDRLSEESDFRCAGSLADCKPSFRRGSFGVRWLIYEVAGDRPDRSSFRGCLLSECPHYSS